MAKSTFITAPGIANFPHLNEPDNRFGDNKYKCGIILDEEGFAHFKAALDDFMSGEKFVAKRPQVPWIQDEDDPTKYIVKASTGYKPAVVDAKNHRLPDDTKVGGGSRIRLAVEFYNYDKGVSLRLKGVRVLELREWSGGSPFDDIEDGYEANTGEEVFAEAEKGDALSI